MFLSRRKGKETSGEQPSLQDDVTRRGKPAPDNTEPEDALLSQVTNLEEMVNKRTKDLEEAREQLKKLYVPPENPAGEQDEDKAEALLTRPNQPEGESADQPGEEKQGDEKELDNLLEKVGEEKAEEPKSEDADDASNFESDDFFGAVEDEENPLAGLIASLPEATIEELLHDAEEIKELASEWLRGEEK